MKANHLLIRTMLSIMIALTIGGCGDDEEGSAANTAEVALVESDVAEDVKVIKEEEIIEATITTRELVSSPDFDFIAKSILDVTLPASPSATMLYFINICTDFTHENALLEINYASCKLRTTLSDAAQSFTLSLSTTERKFVAQVWPIVDEAQPITLYWDVTESEGRWDIVL